MRTWVLVAVVCAASLTARADQPKPADVAERFNEEGRDLFGKGELEEAITKFRAAIAVDPQARYFFNLCFVLNARYQLEAALGACSAVASSDGADDRLKKRAAELIEVIEKKRAAEAAGAKPPDKPEPIKVTDESGEPVLESKPLPPPVDGGDQPEGGDKNTDSRVAANQPKRYPPPIAGRRPGSVRIVTDRPPRKPARKFHFGVLAGFSFAHLTASGMLGGSSGTSTGFTGGGFFSTSLDKVLVGQAEVIYVQRGGGADAAIDPNFEDFSLDYLSFPMIGKLQLPLGRTKIHFDVGFDLAFLVSSSENVPETNAVDAGFILGGGVTFHRRGRSALMFDLRHESGLADSITIMPGAGLKNRTWTLRIGYGF